MSCLRPPRFFRTSLRTAAFVAAAGAATFAVLPLAGCRTSPHVSVKSDVDPEFEALVLEDIAVLPVDGDAELTSTLRRSLYQGLLARGYGVLSPDWVDSGGHTSGRGATLATTLTWVERGFAGAQIVLRDAGGTAAYTSSVVRPTKGATAGELSKLLLRDLPAR